MADYSFVRGPDGGMCGIWLRDASQAQDRELLMMLMVKHDAPESLSTSALSGDFRVVPNTYDDAGGCFIMFGSAPAPGQDSPVSASSGPGSGGGCSVATACCGSPDCFEVVALKRFRDRIMSQSRLGRAVIRLYYRWSPPLAVRLQDRPALKRILRRCLIAPLAILARRMTKQNPAEQKPERDR